MISCEKILPNKIFPFYHRSSVPPIYNYVIQKCFWRNTFSLKKSFSKLVFLFIASFLCTPLMNDAKRINFVWGKQKSVKKIISPKYNFCFNGGSSVLPLTTMSFRKTFSSKNLSVESVFEIQVSITLIFFCAPLILCYKLFKSFSEGNVSVKRKFCKKGIFFSIFGTLYSHS